jgi:hypothetical protein
LEVSLSRSFLIFSLLILFGCRDRNYTEVGPAPPELFVISLEENQQTLSFMLPDAGWKLSEPDGVFMGFIFVNGERSLQVELCLKESRFPAAISRARSLSGGAEMRDFVAGPTWPFIGVIVIYRGPPDAEMLDLFVRSFIVERR